MARGDVPGLPDPNKALECKEKGNRYFQSGDYQTAEQYYTKAYVPIYHDLSYSNIMPQSHMIKYRY